MGEALLRLGSDDTAPELRRVLRGRLDSVPMVAPHTNGGILLDALIRPFTPRVLFPNKTEIDDTERTNQYTGGRAGNQPERQSASDSWPVYIIDFDWPGMFGGLSRSVLFMVLPTVGSSEASIRF